MTLASDQWIVADLVSSDGVRDQGFVVFALASRGVGWAQLFLAAEGNVDVLAWALLLAGEVNAEDWRRATPLPKVKAALADAVHVALRGNGH